MNVTVRITGKRRKQDQPAYRSDMEEYDVVNIDTATLGKSAAAAVLRAIADDLSPAPTPMFAELMSTDQES